MTDTNDMYICKNHVTAINYRGGKCPWCAFKDEMVGKLQSEYRRGFEDGVRAADTEYARKEAENAERSDAGKEPTKADAAVPADIPEK